MYTDGKNSITSYSMIKILSLENLKLRRHTLLQVTQDAFLRPTSSISHFPQDQLPLPIFQLFAKFSFVDKKAETVQRSCSSCVLFT